jgi:hypothetical protein
MFKKRLTEQEIVLETIEFYSNKENRSFNKNGMPCYLNEDGNRCAIGRCLNKLGLAKFKNNHSRITSLVLSQIGYLRKDNYFKPEYWNNAIVFWQNLQDLHDEEQYWTDTGLSKLGKDFIKQAFGIII